LSAERSPEVRANLERAEESIAAAEKLSTAGHHDFAASRAYYAAFYAGTAALLGEELRFSKHSGVISGVHQHFNKTGRIPRSLSDDLKLLNELRIIGDYGEMQHVPEKEAVKAIAAAKRLVEALRKLC